eukprot:PhM_4_TR279/c0_g1_i1/m.55718
MFKNLWIHEAQPYVISAAKRDTVAAALVESVPLLSRPPLFRTSQTVSNRHTNTIYGAMRTCPEMPYKREMFESPLDGGVIALDVCESNSPPLGTALILPGLASHSRSPYIAFFVREMCSRGWRCVVLNARGTGDTPLTTPQMFCAAWTRDVRDVATHVRDKYHESSAKLFIGVGFSLGANVLVKYLGEEGAATPLQAGVSICNPWDLVSSDRHMTTDPIAKRVFSNNLVQGLHEYVKRHEKILRQHHGDEHIDRVPLTRTVHDFDEQYTSRYFGYRDAHHYYSDASSFFFLRRVEVPLFIMDATDDPIVGPVKPDGVWQEAVDANPRVCRVLVEGGGHIGFVDNEMLRNIMTLKRLKTTSFSDRVMARIISEYRDAHV